MPPKKDKDTNRYLEMRKARVHYIRTLRNNTPHPRRKQDRRKEIEKKDKELIYIYIYMSDPSRSWIFFRTISNIIIIIHQQLLLEVIII